MIRSFRAIWPLYAMLAPGIALTLVFAYAPMAGLTLAFKEFMPTKGVFHSPWVGWEHFKFMFAYPDSLSVIWNTLIISVLKIVFGLLAPVVFALLLNEIRAPFFKRSVQTMVYLPHFLSWVMLGGILIDMLNPDGGLVNRVLHGLFGLKPIFFLGDENWFRFTLILSDVWKEFGFSAIVFLAALAGINPSFYESAEVDGAGRWKQTLWITLPALLPLIVVVAALSLGNILNAGFDQIFNLYNPLVYSKGDIIDTFVYRYGVVGGHISFTTAIGMFKSVVGLFMIVSLYGLAARFANYRIF